MTVLHSQSKSRMWLYLSVNDKLSVMTSFMKCPPGENPGCVGMMPHGKLFDGEFLQASSISGMFCHNFPGNKSVKIGAFTLLTSRFLKSRHLDPTIYTCAKNREVSVSQNFTIFWLVVRMCDHRLQCMHECMQYAWGPRISIHVSKSARS